MVDKDKSRDSETDEDRNGQRLPAASSNSEPQTGDPGRTPGSAEGDEATVDEDLREKEREGKL